MMTDVIQAVQAAAEALPTDFELSSELLNAYNNCRFGRRVPLPPVNEEHTPPPPPSSRSEKRARTLPRMGDDAQPMGGGMGTISAEMPSDEALGLASATDVALEGLTTREIALARALARPGNVRVLESGGDALRNALSGVLALRRACGAAVRVLLVVEASEVQAWRDAAMRAQDEIAVSSFVRAAGTSRACLTSLRKLRRPGLIIASRDHLEKNARDSSKLPRVQLYKALTEGGGSSWELVLYQCAPKNIKSTCAAFELLEKHRVDSLVLFSEDDAPPIMSKVQKYLDEKQPDVKAVELTIDTDDDDDDSTQVDWENVTQELSSPIESDVQPNAHALENVPIIQTIYKPETHTKPKSTTKPTILTKPKSHTKPRSLTKPEIPTKPKTPAKPEPELETPSKVETELETLSKVEPELETPSKVEPELETPSKVEPELETPIKSEPEHSLPSASRVADVPKLRLPMRVASRSALMTIGENQRDLRKTLSPEKKSVPPTPEREKSSPNRSKRAPRRLEYTKAGSPTSNKRFLESLQRMSQKKSAARRPRVAEKTPSKLSPTILSAMESPYVSSRRKNRNYPPVNDEERFDDYSNNVVIDVDAYDSDCFVVSENLRLTSPRAPKRGVSKDAVWRDFSKSPVKANRKAKSPAFRQPTSPVLRQSASSSLRQPARQTTSTPGGKRITPDEVVIIDD